MKFRLYVDFYFALLPVMPDTEQDTLLNRAIGASPDNRFTILTLLVKRGEFLS